MDIPNVYKSQIACRLCGITPRKLDYWIATGVFEPSHVYVRKERRRLLFLFTFEDLVRLRTIRELREAGLPLQKIRAAIEHMNERYGKRWSSGWLVTDGESAYLRHDGRRVEKLAGKNAGQLAFAVVAAKEAVTQVSARLRALVPFRHKHLGGAVERYKRVVGPP